jgi:hypothetical protein
VEAARVAAVRESAAGLRRGEVVVGANGGAEGFEDRTFCTGEYDEFDAAVPFKGDECAIDGARFDVGSLLPCMFT